MRAIIIVSSIILGLISGCEHKCDCDDTRRLLLNHKQETQKRMNRMLDNDSKILEVIKNHLNSHERGKKK